MLLTKVSGGTNCDVNFFQFYAGSYELLLDDLANSLCCTATPELISPNRRTAAAKDMINLLVNLIPHNFNFHISSIPMFTVILA
jgi:hypothetical protein